MAATPVASESPPLAVPKTAGVAWGAPVSDLRLGIELEGTKVVAHVQNVGTAPLMIMSHVATHERQSDWLTVTITDTKSKERVVAFNDDRDKSAPVAHTLASGAELVDRWDLADWAARPRNGARPLGSNDVAVRASYHVVPAPTTIPPIGPRAWGGTIESGTVPR